MKSCFCAHVRFAAFGLILTAVACTPNWVAEPIRPQRVLTEGPIRITKTDESVILLRAPVTVSDSLAGIALNDPNRRIAIPMSEVLTVETRGSRKPTAMEVVRGYLLYVTALMAVAAIAITLQ